MAKWTAKLSGACCPFIPFDDPTIVTVCNNKGAQTDPDRWLATVSLEAHLGWPPTIVLRQTTLILQRTIVAIKGLTGEILGSKTARATGYCNSTPRGTFPKREYESSQKSSWRFPKVSMKEPKSRHVKSLKSDRSKLGQFRIVIISKQEIVGPLLTFVSVNFSQEFFYVDHFNMFNLDGSTYAIEDQPVSSFNRKILRRKYLLFSSSPWTFIFHIDGDENCFNLSQSAT